MLPVPHVHQGRVDLITTEAVTALPDLTCDHTTVNIRGLIWVAHDIPPSRRSLSPLRTARMPRTSTPRIPAAAVGASRRATPIITATTQSTTPAAKTAVALIVH